MQMISEVNFDLVANSTCSKYFNFAKELWKKMSMPVPTTDEKKKS